MPVSKEYAKFEFITGNRPINWDHVDRLKASLADRNWVLDNEILVDADFKIIEGQHRFLALEAMGLEVPYKQSSQPYSIQDIIKINTVVRPWKTDDFIHSYACLGNQNFILLKEQMSQHDISASIILFILFSHTDAKAIKEGTLQFADPQVEQLAEFFEKLSIFNEYPFYKNLRFVRAFKRLCLKPSYDHDAMGRQVQNYPDKLKRQASWGVHYMDLIKAYNYNRPKENRIHLEQADIDEWTNS